MMNDMRRLFIAIELPPAIKSALARLQTQLRNQLPPKVVRWTQPDSIHLTLKFLGDTPVHRVHEVAEGMQRAASGFQTFELTVAGLGCFPNPHKARVIWVGIPDMPRDLAGLQRATDLQMAKLDWERETRPFSPHLTLGRVNKRVSAPDLRALAALLTKTQVGTLGMFPVDQVILFQSDLQPTGTVYTALAHARLEPSQPLAPPSARSL